MSFRGAGTFALLTAVAPYAQAQIRPTMDIESLEVIPAVLVVVEGITADAEADGLSATDLRQGVENMLHHAGIATLSEKAWSDLIGNPALQLSFQLLKASPHLYLYTATVELRQLTVLVRDSTKGAWTRTWSAGSLLGTRPTANLPSLELDVRTLVRRFITEYARAMERRGVPHDLRAPTAPAGVVKTAARDTGRTEGE